MTRTLASEREISAGGVVYRMNGAGWEVVLAARRHEDGRLAWSFPKGRLEPGETLADAAVREVREETGLQVAVQDRLGDVTYRYVRRGDDGSPLHVHKRVRYFLMRHTGGHFADRDDEMDDVQWIALREAPRMVRFRNERMLLRKVSSLLGVVDAGGGR